MKFILKLVSIALPWKIRRIYLNAVFNYKIHSKAKLGLNWVFPKKLIMEEGTRIDHFTVVINIEKLEMRKHSKIGRSNWITGFPKNNTKHFTHQSNRAPELIINEHSAITKKHHIDCTNTVSIGKYVTIAGYNSQLLTHSINVYENRQDSSPILIGDYCFIGTNTVILGGATIPSYCVIGAKSLVNKKLNEEYCLYGGNPAKKIKILSSNAKYFNRTRGFVN